MRYAAAAFLLGLMVPGLQGCFPIVAGGVVAGALIVEDRRTKGSLVEDQEIELRATSRINLKYRDDSHINVTSYNRNVLLTGEAASEVIRNDVEAIVRDIEHVRNITNEVSVAGNSSIASRSNDTLITSKVKSRFVTDAHFQANHVKVVTENSVVYLLGIVTRKEAQEAGQLASGTGGVQRVVKVLEYEDKLQTAPAKPAPPEYDSSKGR